MAMALAPTDSSSTGAYVKVSLVNLAEDCFDVPDMDHKHRDFLRAAEPFDDYRDKVVGHNDLNKTLKPHSKPLPGLSRSQVDNILSCARAILNAIYSHYAKTELSFEVIYKGAQKDLLHHLTEAQKKKSVP